MNAEPSWLDLRDIVAIHLEIIESSGGTTGILSQSALESTIHKPKNLYFYAPNSTLWELAAAYGYGFLKNHCFVDGNKRIALIAIYTFLGINGMELVAPEVETAAFFLELAASDKAQQEILDKLIMWLMDNIRFCSIDD